MELTKASVPYKQFGSFDDLSNRKLLSNLLERLGRGVLAEEACRRRRAFLAWCIRHSRGIGPILMDPKTVGQTWEIYWDVVALAAVYHLDLSKAVTALENWIARLR
jgi:hypothetical protein